MTHARKNASIGQYRVEGRGHVERWSHGETVGGAWPVHSLREGKAKKDMAKKVKSSGRESQCLEKHSMKMNETKTKKGKCNTTSECHRKLYPLRGRSEAKSCHVLLTRLDDETKVCEVDPNRVSGHKKKPKPYKKAENSRESLQERLKTKPEATIDKPSAQEPRKRRLASLNAEALNSLLLEKTDGPPGAKLARKQGGGSSTTEQTKTGSKRAEKTCQKPKRMKKASTDKMHDALSLYAPTPRRLAGLNAAALLKLTSSTAANKHRIKTDRKTVCKPQAQKSGKHSWTQPELEGACEVCKSRSFESKPTTESHRLAEAGYQSMLGYRPVKLVKEEPVEAELSPYFCCPPEGSVGYCHRLALFLGRQAYGEGEEQPVVKHECLVPAHPALTLSAHPCLCVDPCCSSYYVHIAHPGTASLSARMLPCTHSGSQLLASSGVPHPAFCGSVGSPCCGEACRVSGYAFSAVQSRTCSFSTNCSSCSHPIKTEEEHSRTVLVPPALPRSGCPGMPRVTPRLLSTTSEAEVRLKVGKECPQITKPSNGSLTMGHSRSSQKHPTASAKHQKKASRRQATNGWRPVGVPTEKEVFIAGDDETVLRQSYEGVERDGEVIRVRDTVLVRSGPRKKSLPYVAKISALWEDPRTGELMMSLFWYYRPEHTQGGRDPSMHCENEIFASRHQDENSVACIEERCYVLPLAQYCRFCALVKRRSEGMSDHAPLVPRPSDSADHAHRPVPRPSDGTGPAHRLVPYPSDSTGPAHRPVPHPSDGTGPAHRPVPHPSDSTGPAHRPVPHPSDGTGPAHRLVPDGIDPQLVYLCRHVYDFRYGRILKNLQ